MQGAKSSPPERASWGPQQESGPRGEAHEGDTVGDRFTTRSSASTEIYGKSSRPSGWAAFIIRMPASSGLMALRG